MTMNLYSRKTWCKCGTPVVLLVAVQLAQAQVLEEVIVTAQKRVESLQDVPISVRAISGNFLQDSGITNLERLSMALPNVDISDSPTANQVIIRGLGSGSGNPAFEQSVGLYVDGIYASKASLFQSPFLDIERIEVLKGPQGVLFGKNSVAGAISILTRKPTPEFEANITGSYEFENEGYGVDGAVSGSLLDNVYGRFAFEQREAGPYMHNGFLNDDVPDPETGTYRGTLVWDATDSTQVMLKLETSEVNEKGGNWQVLVDEAVGTSELQFLGGQLYDASVAGGEDYVWNNTSWLNEPVFLDQENDSVTLRVDQQVGEFQLTYLYGYAQYDRHQLVDNDFSAVNAIATRSTEDYHQNSHELRITSPTGQAIDYIGGLYYLDRKFDREGQISALAFFPPAAHENNREFSEDAESWAAFAQATWNITDAFRTTGGIRYSDEEKKASNNQLLTVFGSDESLQQADPVAYDFIAGNFGTPDFSYAGSRSEDNWDPMVNVQWDFLDGAMAYASWTKASKGGGFNANENNGSVDNFSFEPEHAESYEIGAKMEFMDNRARLNVAVFDTDFEDLQTASFDPVLNTFAVKNAAKASTSGVELDGEFAVLDDLTVGASIAYLDAQYDDFVASCPASSVQQAKRECFPVVEGSEELVQDLSGEQLEKAPEWSSALFAEYSRPVLDGLRFGTRVDAFYKDDSSLDFSQDENLKIDGYWIYNLRLSLDGRDDRWTVALGLFNIGDEQVINDAGQSFLMPGFYYANRSVGREAELSATLRF